MRCFVRWYSDYFLHKWVFNFDLNMVNDSDCLVFAGNAFHILRSAALKALPPVDILTLIKSLLYGHLIVGWIFHDSIVCCSNIRDHITPIFNDLHWIHVKKKTYKQCIDHTILSITLSCVYGIASEYLIKTIPKHDLPSRAIRSTSQLIIVQLSVDSTNKVKLDWRLFCNAATRVVEWSMCITETIQKHVIF